MFRSYIDAVEEWRKEADLSAIFTWLLLIAALLVVEAMTAGLTTIWFAGGAAGHWSVHFWEDLFWLQTGLFAAVSLILLLVTRPLPSNTCARETAKQPGPDDRKGSACHRRNLTTFREPGEAQLDGQFWMAVILTVIRRSEKEKWLSSVPYRESSF